MGIGKRGQGSSKTVWMDLRGKEGTLVAWNRAEQREEEFSYVFGRLVDVRVKERSYGDSTGYVVNITLRDPESGERYIVSTPAASRHSCRLLGQLNNADLSQVLYLAPYVLHEGDALANGETVKYNTAMTSLKYVQGVEEDRLILSDGIHPYYNEAYGDKMPAGEAVLRADGKPLVNNGVEVKDYAKLEALVAELVQGLSAKLAPGHQQAEVAGVDPHEAADAAREADRSAMRARA